ncbi:MAG: phosphotransferase [Bacillota bacterium]|nr:phosphotransferase [Bacillota bacterium]
MLDFNPELTCEVWGFNKLEVNKIIKAGGLKTIYLLETDAGLFILTGLGPSLAITDVLNYVLALDYLSEQPVCVAPRIRKCVDGSLFTRMGNNLVYIVEYIQGRTLKQNPEDEYRLGQAAARLHSFDGFKIESRLRVKDTIGRAYEKFNACPCQDKYYAIIKAIPDFDRLKQGFIHTDIAPHNAIMNKDGEPILIDFDGAGRGSIYIDAGFPLITQFVRFHADGVIKFNSENAKAFYSGYQSVTKIRFWEKPLIFYGALFWQLMHMPSYIPGGKNEMFEILNFALENKKDLISVI